MSAGPRAGEMRTTISITDGGSVLRDRSHYESSKCVKIL